jgi:dolichol-phosphate mannosyltransferase
MLSVIIPTFNEAENIAEIIRRTQQALNPLSSGYEILIVDDASDDGTADIARPLLDGKGMVIRRSADARSLSLSVMDGIRASRGDLIVVMDADGSHPPELIPSLVKETQNGYDLAIASRYVPGGGSSGFPLIRRLGSRFACFIGNMVTPVKDNTAGFFCIKRGAIEGVGLTPKGFKIGLEIFVKSKAKSFREVPYIFVNRKKGKSKLKANTIWQYFCQVRDLKAYRRKRR